MLNEGLTKKRLNKLKAMFTIAERGIGDLENAGREEIEKFVTKLHRGTFCKMNGSPYSGSTKSDIKRFLKQFYKWFKGDGEFFPKEVSWIKTRIGKDEKPEEKPIITPDEIREISTHFRRSDFRLMTLLLFDSGFRISEMFSVTKDRLSWEPFDDEGNCCWWVECTESKTYPRKVAVGLFTEEISQYVHTAPFTKLAPADKLFPFSDTLYRAALAQASKKVLKKKKLTPHALRHSSATLYAGIYQGDRIKLAERYGWSYSAQELDTYVRRNGQGLKEGAKVVYKNEVQKLQDENERLKQELEKLKEQIDDLPRMVEELVAKSNPEQVRESLKRKEAAR